MKKFLGIVLSLGLVLGLAGCGSKTEPASTSPVDTSNIKMGKVEYAAHGTKCFTIAVATVSGDTIVGAYLDDYQFMSTDVATGVPNSDKDFAKGYADPKNVLASKKANTEYYNKNMKEKGNATTPVEDSLAAIEKYVTGKTVADLEKVLKDTSTEKMVDTVSGATLVDTKGYVSALVEAAKAAK
ncbi:hypothetical protein D3C81_563290 [compost metagenome]